MQIFAFSKRSLEYFGKETGEGLLRTRISSSNDATYNYSNSYENNTQYRALNQHVPHLEKTDGQERKRVYILVEGRVSSC